MLRLIPLLLLALSACATARADRALIAALPVDRLPADFARSTALAVSAGLEAQDPRSLEEQLARFEQASSAERAAMAPGAAMPDAQHARWTRLLESLDARMQEGDAELTGADGAAARELLLTQLALDAGSYGSLPEGFLEEVREVAAELGPKAAPKAATRRNRTAPELAWPMSRVQLTSGFGSRKHPIYKRMRHHKGIDLAAAKGDEILSAGKGVVVRAGRHRDYGLHVHVDHGNGVITTYSHLSSILVKRGEKVTPGMLVGLAGRSGRATGVHLHFEVHIDGRAVNPLKFLGPLPTGDTPVLSWWFVTSSHGV